MSSLNRPKFSDVPRHLLAADLWKEPTIPHLKIRQKPSMALVHRAEGCRLHTLGTIVATVLAESALSQIQTGRCLPGLIFVPPRAQQEAFVLSAVWTGLRLNVGQVGIATEMVGRQLREQPD
jgi:hypothetical protein